MLSLPSCLISCALGSNPQDVSLMVEKEVKNLKENWARLEEEYVEQHLLENPIIIERRTNNNQQQQSISDGSDDTDASRRAEACRRSRYKNKIKKAKNIYRHRFMSQKLLKSWQLFDNIQDLIVKAEANLLSRGITTENLQDLRGCFGLEADIESLRNLDNIMGIDVMD